MRIRDKVRDCRAFVRCLPWRVGEAIGLWSGAGAPIQYVVEREEWAIKWVGSNLFREIESIRAGAVELSSSPSKLAQRVVHFGSQYMWLGWRHYTSKSNRYVVSFFHGKPEDGPDVARHVDEFLSSVPSLERVITGATLTERRLLQWGVPKEKLIRIPIGVDTQLFKPPQSGMRAEVRKKYGIPEHAIVIGSFQKDGQGWGDGLEPKLIKGPDIYAAVMAKMKLSGLPVFSFLTGPARGYVKKRLNHYNVPFVHTYVANHSDLLACYHALDLYLVTSREEGGPMGLLESMACGVPVVSTPVGMAPDLIRDGYSGALSSECAVDVIEEKIMSILELSDAGLSQVKSRALEAVRSVDWSVIGRRHWTEVYEPLLK